MSEAKGTHPCLNGVPLSIVSKWLKSGLSLAALGEMTQSLYNAELKKALLDKLNNPSGNGEYPERPIFKELQ